MKTIFTILLLTTILSHSDSLKWKKIRIWENLEGKKIQGTLESATKDKVRIRKQGETFSLPVASLSEENVNFVNEYLKSQKIKLRANSARWTHPPNKKLDSRRVKVEVDDVNNREISISITWLGDDGDKSKYGIHTKDTKKVNEDGEVNFDIVYHNKKKKKFDRNYRGFAVRVTTDEGIILGETASQTPFLRFLK